MHPLRKKERGMNNAAASTRWHHITAALCWNDFNDDFISDQNWLICQVFQNSEVIWRFYQGVVGVLLSMSSMDDCMSLEAYMSVHTWINYFKLYCCSFTAGDNVIALSVRCIIPTAVQQLSFLSE